MIKIFGALLLIISLETISRSLVFSNSQIEERYQNYLKKSTDLDVVIFGVCPMIYSLRPEYLEKKSFNFAHFDESLYYTSEYFKKVVAVKPPPIAIINISGPLLFSPVSYPDIGIPDEDAHRKMLIRDSDDALNITSTMPRNIFNEIADQSNFLLFKEYILMRTLECITTFKCSKEVMASFKDDGSILLSDSSIHDDGFIFRVENPNEYQKLATHLFSKFFDPKSFDANTQLIIEIVKTAKENNVKIIFISPPVFSAAQETIKTFYPDDLMSKYQTFIKRIVSENKNISFIDSENFFSEKKDEVDYFFSELHLNNRGAREFSSYINQNLQNLLQKK